MPKKRFDVKLEFIVLIDADTQAEAERMAIAKHCNRMPTCNGTFERKATAVYSRPIPDHIDLSICEV